MYAGKIMTTTALSEQHLEILRVRLLERGQRPSLVLAGGAASAAVIEAIQVVEEYGPLCELSYLIMIADNKVSNLERDVLRGALRTISNNLVRSSHMESMIDHIAHQVVEQGAPARLNHAIARLLHMPARAEVAYIIAHAVAEADGPAVESEKQVLATIAQGLGIHPRKAIELLTQLGVHSL